MASYMTDSNMAGTTISRHDNVPIVRINVYEAKHGNKMVIGCMNH